MEMRQILLSHTARDRELYYSPEAVDQLALLGEVVLNPYDHHLTADEMLALAPRAAALVTEWATGADASYFSRATDLRILVRSGVEILNVDFEAATAAGVIVANTPGLYVTPVVEMAIAFMICLAHGIVDRHCALQRGVVPPPKVFFELCGKTLGIVGLGDIGVQLARAASGLGMAVLGYDPYATVEEGCLRQTSLAEVLGSSDFVSINAKLTPQTRGMIGRRELGQMRPGSFLINTARGPIVDEPALVWALESGHLAGAAVDVYATEPDFLASPLLRAPNIITTPHIGGFSRGAMRRQALATVRAVRRALAGEVPHPDLQVVNTEVLQSPALRARKR